MASLREYGARNIPDLREMLWGSAGIFGTATAIRERREGVLEDISFARLKEEVEALGTALATRLSPNAHVLVLGKSGYDWVLSYLTLICGAGIPVPVDEAITPEELAALAVESDATAILYAAEAAEKIAALPGTVAISFAALPQLIAEGKEALAAGNESYRGREIDPHAPASLFYTSGTTGRAKGVVLSHANIAFLFTEMAKTQRIQREDRFLSVLPLSHAYGLLLGVLFPLYCGASVAFAEHLGKLLAAMREVRPTTLVVIPMLAEAILEKYWQTVTKNGVETEVRRVIAATDPIRPLTARQAMKEKLLATTRRFLGGELRRMLVVGAPLSAAVQKGLRQIGIFALQGYGVTECAGLAALGREDVYRDGTAGLSFPRGVLDIYDPQPDGSGEIRYKGDNVMLGYYKDEARTKEVLRHGWYYTGDIGRIDADGFLHVIGRKQNSMQNADGKIVCPEELEALLAQGPLVKEAVVVGVPAENGKDYELAAVISPNLPPESTPEEGEALMSEWIHGINATLPTHKQIALFTLWQSPLPRDGAGRVLRRALAEELAEA